MRMSIHFPISNILVPCVVYYYFTQYSHKQPPSNIAQSWYNNHMRKKLTHNGLCHKCEYCQRLEKELHLGSQLYTEMGFKFNVSLLDIDHPTLKEVANIGLFPSVERDNVIFFVPEGLEGDVSTKQVDKIGTALGGIEWKPVWCNTK